MNREIKFRVWDTITEKYYGDMATKLVFASTAGQYNKFSPQLSIMRQIRSQITYTDKNVNDLIFEQYTGLKDKNGVEIYEGDIVKSTWKLNNPYGYSPKDWDEDEEIVAVKYSPPEFNLKERFGDGGQVCIKDFEREVIGNIHENPELLKS